MTPMSTAEGINVDPGVVIPIVLVASVLVIAAAAFRGFLVDALDGLADIWRTYGPVAALRALDHRPGLPATPWFCDRCRSANGLAASRCYRCGARREDAEAADPVGELPSGPSAGFTQRTRRRG